MKKTDMETILVPKEFADLVARRTADILRASVRDRNILKTLAQSCYLQGLIDGSQASQEAEK